MSSTSRRKFVAHSGVAAIAEPFLSTSITRAVAERSRPKPGWALCGLGGLAENQKVHVLDRHGDFMAELKTLEQRVGRMWGAPLMTSHGGE